MARTRNTDVKGRHFTPEVIEAVWEKGHRVRGRDPSVYRSDDCGNIIYKASYGMETRMGWEIDHRKPVASGGTDHGNNLRPLQSSANAEKGDTYPWRC